jgi:hypothetical protein
MDMRQLIETVRPLVEAKRWGKVGRSNIFRDPSRSDFVALMSGIRKKHDIPNGDAVMRGFMMSFDRGILVFDAWELTHDDVLAELGDEIGGYSAIRLNFWTDTGVVGIGSDNDAEKVKSDPWLHKMMGGDFEVEVAY